MDFEGILTMPLIRNFLSKNHQLHSQAGAGIVAGSDEESEMEEVYNKLRALNKALDCRNYLKNLKFNNLAFKDCSLTKFSIF
jgi:anthranilate/para-aminobenzoate synthase component I